MSHVLIVYQWNETDQAKDQREIKSVSIPPQDVPILFQWKMTDHRWSSSFHSPWLKTSECEIGICINNFDFEITVIRKWEPRPGSAFRGPPSAAKRRSVAGLECGLARLLAWVKKCSCCCIVDDWCLTLMLHVDGCRWRGAARAGEFCDDFLAGAKILLGRLWFVMIDDWKLSRAWARAGLVHD